MKVQLLVGELRSALDKLRDPDILYVAVEKAAERVVEDIKAVTPVKTGALRDSIEVDGFSEEVEIHSPLPYSGTVNARTGFFTDTVLESAPRHLEREIKDEVERSLG